MNRFLGIYGYENGGSNLLTLEAVTIQASAEVLREAASFFIACAEGMEKHPDWDHEHLKDYLKNKFPEAPEIIVASPPRCSGQT